MLFSAGAWSSVNQIGVLLFLQIDLMTANLVLGPSEAGVYAAIIQFPLLLRSLAGTLASLFAPVLTSYYSKGDMEGLLSYANKAVRMNGLLLALPAALLGGLAEPFLAIWLGPSFVQTAPLLYIHAAYLAVSLSVMPLFTYGRLLINKNARRRYFMFRRTECHIGRGSQRTGTSRAVRHHHRRCSLSHFEKCCLHAAVCFVYYGLSENRVLQRHVRPVGGGRICLGCLPGYPAVFTA